jgi:hypothetical protein
MQLSNQRVSHPKHKNDHRPPGFADGGKNQGLLPTNRTSLSKRLWKVWGIASVKLPTIAKIVVLSVIFKI